MANRLLVAWVLSAAPFAAADGPFAVYSQEVPKFCKELGPVEYSETFKMSAPEARTPRGELEQRFRDKCAALAREKGGNAISSPEVTHFRGRGNFGYECRAVVLKC